ncbi:protein of unknown function (plasmid) [Cupriavidus taiwanensis]|nr:protein of unknown function [Cupriavidus taiwanensis]
MTQALVQTPQADGPPAVGMALQALRQQHRLSLDELSRRAGVSKSMLSQIERNLANPTVAVLWRLANALGVNLADFLAGGRRARRRRHHRGPAARDPVAEEPGHALRPAHPGPDRTGRALRVV